MASQTTSLLNAEASYRQEVKRYIANLAILDRRVLDCRAGVRGTAAGRRDLRAGAVANSSMKWRGDNNED
jgi:hypothetical protein